MRVWPTIIIVLALVVLAIALPQYHGVGYMQQLKNRLDSEVTMDDVRKADSEATFEGPSKKVNLADQGQNQEFLRVFEEAYEDAMNQQNDGMEVIFSYYGISCANNFIRRSVQSKWTKWVKRHCNGRNSCSGLVTTSVLGDPYPHCSKDFIAIARCPNGKIIADLISASADNKRFELYC